ncbi:hypothetical protein DM826_09245 [Halonotius aquaticus]|uniref:Uncharacterized protein n=1 Tax=Halonotius aquaticus TaxID=2216978 RepID=A0A3A6PKH8_9EURY|nr:hypothetical protein [Halonotius aquaticus]RJX42552.1 hypothetical protein DM826_09245 [Halonotius aquaticus]
MHVDTPAFDRETVRSLIAVLTQLKNTDTATGHDDLLSAAIARVWACYDGEPFEIDPESITAADVETAHTALTAHSPTQQDAQAYREAHGTPHPNMPLKIGFDFVDTASRYRTGSLPSFRSWKAIYSYEGAVIAERAYDHEDAIALRPVIDDVRYTATATKRDADGTVRVTLTERPFRTDIDVYIHENTGQTVTIEGHDGPNVPSETHPISTLEAALDSEGADDTEICVTESLDDVVAFIDDHGWEYDADDDVDLPE